jgi:hypothetical protein
LRRAVFFCILIPQVGIMRPRLIKKYITSFFLTAILAGIATVADASSHITTPASCPATLTQGVVSVPYSYTFMGSAGNPWSIISGSLPPGLTLNTATGVLSGTPTSAGTFSFTIQLNAFGGTSASCACMLTIVGGSCSFVGTSTGNISFSNIDPSSAATIYGTVVQQVSFNCNTTGLAYAISVSPGSGWTMTSGSNTLPFTLGIAPNGTYAGTAVNLLIDPPSAGSSSIVPVNFQNLPALTYSNAGAVTITVAWAGGSIVATVPIGGVSGTIINTCVISQSPGALTFSIDPSVIGTTNATISPDLQLKCTKNGNVTITASSICGGAMYSSYPPSCSGSSIPYTFTCLGSATTCSGNTTGLGFSGSGISLGLSGSVSSNNYKNAPVGSYGDLQTVTITY